MGALEKELEALPYLEDVMNMIRNASRHATHALPVVSLVIAAACASNPQYPDYGRDRDRSRDHVTPTDANGDVRNERRDDAGRYAHKPPPADIVENPSGQPGPQYVWVVGHYTWDGNDFQWQPGQWAMPPNGYRTWRPGRWDQVGNNNWAYSEGQWQ